MAAKPKSDRPSYAAVIEGVVAYKGGKDLMQKQCNLAVIMGKHAFMALTNKAIGAQYDENAARIAPPTTEDLIAFLRGYADAALHTEWEEKRPDLASASLSPEFQRTSERDAEMLFTHYPNLVREFIKTGRTFEQLGCEVWIVRSRSGEGLFSGHRLPEATRSALVSAALSRGYVTPFIDANGVIHTK